MRTLSPPDALYAGDPVTLQCDITKFEDWISYKWFRDDQEIPMEANETFSFSVTGGTVHYRCQGMRNGRPRMSAVSDRQSLTARGELQAPIK